MSDRVRALEAIKRAKQEVCDVASGRKRWTMCVPVQEGTDTDRVLMNALTLAESALAAATPGEPTWKAHVPVTSDQHDPENGLIHGFCERCRTPWPCQWSPESRPTPTPETIERVARWIKARFYPRMAEWERLDDITRNDLLYLARAAIRAMGEGT